MSVSKNAMSKTKSTEQSANGGGRIPPQFVQYRLSEDEMAAARDACREFKTVQATIETWIEQGYKFSASHDNYGGGVQVFITTSKQDHPNAFFTLSARAPDLRLAVGMLAYKHYSLFGEVWPKEGAQRQGSDWG